MRLPTVVLRHRQTGRIRIVNETAYARDVARFADYKLETTRHGDASHLDELIAAAEDDVQRHRLDDPEEAKKRGDRDRHQQQRAITTNVETGEQEAEAAALPGDWRDLHHMRRIKLARELTGVTAANKEEADASLEAYEAKRVGA